MKYFILTIVCLIGNSIFAQDKKICEGIVGIAIDAVNNSSTIELKKFHLCRTDRCYRHHGSGTISYPIG